MPFCNRRLCYLHFNLRSELFVKIWNLVTLLPVKWRELRELRFSFIQRRNAAEEKEKKHDTRQLSHIQSAMHFRNCLNWKCHNFRVLKSVDQSIIWSPENWIGRSWGYKKLEMFGRVGSSKFLRVRFLEMWNSPLPLHNGKFNDAETNSQIAFYPTKPFTTS